MQWEGGPILKKTHSKAPAWEVEDGCAKGEGRYSSSMIRHCLTDSKVYNLFQLSFYLLW